MNGVPLIIDDFQSEPLLEPSPIGTPTSHTTSIQIFKNYTITKWGRGGAILFLFTLFIIQS